MGGVDFEALYRSDPDPWQVADSPYEQRKLGLVLAVLGRSTYSQAWDAGCGTGHLTRRLTDRAEAVLATDAAAEAVALSTEHCADRPQARVLQSCLPDPPPAGTQPDLIVLSEVCYYLDDEARARTVTMLDESAAPTAELVAVHWKGVPEDGRLSGLGAQHDLVSRLALGGWSQQTHHDDVEFVIDTLIRRQRRRARS